jgi:hypothetical protein
MRTYQQELMSTAERLTTCAWADPMLRERYEPLRAEPRDG